jgi:hypothetical protein
MVIVKKQKKRMMDDIQIFGLPHCPYTKNAVTLLARNGHFPFAYHSIRVGTTREAFWDKVQKKAPELTLQRTFPTIIVKKPQPQVYGSEGASVIAANLKPVGPSEGSSVHQAIQRAMAHGHDFVFVPSKSAI